MRCTLAALLLGAAGFAHAAAPLAGSAIDNQAEATYFDIESGQHARLKSNLVRVLVQAQEAISLGAAQSQIRPVGGVAMFAHRVINTGNTPSRFSVTASNAAGDDFDLQQLVVVRDANGNGRADPGEEEIAAGATLEPLAPGASMDLLVIGRLDTTLRDGQVARVQLGATTIAQGAIASVSDSVTVGDGAQLQLTKSASAARAAPGQVLRFTLTASNNGNRPAAGVAVQVDGAPMQLVLLRDGIPANTRFEAFGTAAAALALLHRRGDAPYSFVTTAPTDTSTVDAVAFGFAAGIARGQTVERRFEVRVNANAAGALTNTAQLVFDDGINPGASSLDSNAVQVAVPARQPTLGYYADSAYTRPLHVMPAGAKFYIAIDAAQCNADPQRAETKQIVVQSKLTGDRETFFAEETAANSGVFHVQPHVQSIDAATLPAVRGDGLLSTRANDHIVTTLEGCGTAQIEVALLIDPFGVVFDSHSNLPVAGATVMLVDVTGAGNGGNAGGAARVLQADAVTVAPSTIVTGADGHFAFPLVAPSRYRLVITAPAGYAFPSAQPVALQPAGRTVVGGSYGSAFAVDASTGAVELDVPLDALRPSGLLIDKSASRNSVELGEFLDYTVRVRNVSAETLGRIVVTDRLPAGFAYVRGSARLNGGRTRWEGLPLEEPDGGVGPRLGFQIGSLPDQATATLTYRVRVGPGALQGDGINRVQASTPAPLARFSNDASATVQVLPGVFNDRGFVVGKVYASCAAPADETPSDGLGVPGVRLYLQDGTHVTTDRNGRFSLYGLASRTHVLKLDATTLAGLVPRITANRQAGDAASRFIDIQRGELHRADFALEGCNADTRREIDARIAAAQSERSEEEAALATRFSTEPVTQTDPRSLPAMGVIGAAPNTAPPKSVPPVAPPASTFRNERIAALRNALLEIVSPTANQALTQAQTNVVVKGDSGTRFSLSVNGDAVSEQRIGQRSEVAERRLQVWQYIGVALLAGRNVIEVEQFDAANRSIGRHRIEVIAPGALSALRLRATEPQPKADGKTAISVTLEPLDADGVVLGARTPVTLDTTLGHWRVRDLNPDEPGVQTFIEGGRATLELLPPSEPGTALLRASSGAITTQAEIAFAPDLRPLLAVGIVEGAIHLRRGGRASIEPVRAHDGFEQELRSLSADFDHGRGQAGARASLFLKGRIKGDMLLTLAYDSEKEKKERLFRDIQPDAYYAVYGDSSVRGFDAQSTDRLYLRLDHSRFYALVGDFNTQALGGGDDIGQRKLGAYSRSLNGTKGQWRSADGASDVTAFASRGASRQVVQEIRALGISGPYALDKLPLVENSEKVELITRDRDLPSRILRTVAAQRFADYEIEPMTGRLLFRAPVPSLDSAFNPNFIRVTYEVDQGGAAFWVGGVEARHKAGDRIALAASAVIDDNPLDALRLTSAQSVVQLGEKTALAVEGAHVEHGLTSTIERAGGGARGNAGRIEFKHEDARWQVQAQAIRADAGFDNPSAGVPRGQLDVGARVAFRADDRTVLRAETLRSESMTNDALRIGSQVTVERQITPLVRGEVGVRQSAVSGAQSTPAAAGAAPYEGGTSVRAKLLAQVPSLDNSSLFVEAEQDLDEGSAHTFAVGGESRIGGGLRVYGRHELVSSLGNRYSLNDTQQRHATVFGIAGDSFAQTQAFGEYRLHHAIAGPEAEAAMGLRRRFELGRGLGASAGIERVRVLDGPDNNESVAVTSALDYSDGGDWRANARFEVRDSPRTDSVLNTLGLAWRFDTPWTALARNALSLTRNNDGSHTAEDWFQLGLAWRDIERNRSDALLRAEWRGAQGLAADGAQRQRHAFVVSAHGNRQWMPGTVLSGRVASKWVRETALGQTGRDDTQLLAARVTHDLDEHWDLSLHAAVLARGLGRANQYGLGTEAGYGLAKNLWLSGGYNLFGYHDRDLAGQDHTQPGVFVRLRFKFDENSLH
jgi:large repetitive protein